MIVFRGKHEKRVCAIKVLLVLAGADAVRVAICKEVLACWVTSVCEALEQGCSFVNEVFASVQGLFYLDEVTRSVGWDRPCLGSVYHEDGEFELEGRVLSLLCIGAVEFQGALM